MKSGTASKTRKRAPSPRTYHPLGHLAAIDRDPLNFFLDAQRRHGEVVRLRLGHLEAHLITDPDGAHHVLSENNKNYSKQTPLISTLKLLMGEGLITSESSFWIRQRRIVAPAFHRQRIRGSATEMVRATKEMLDEWKGRPHVLDVREELLHLTLRIASDILLGPTTQLDADVLNEAAAFSNRYIYRRARTLVPVPLWIPTLDNLRFLRHRAAVDSLVYRMIAERRAQARAGQEGRDMLSLLMAMRDQDTGESMNDRQVRDEVVTIMVAGHETTANALAWALHLLSENPAVAQRMREEVDRVLANEPLELETLAKLPYTTQVVEEALRLYPTGWILTRTALGDDEVAGYSIKAGSLVFVSPYITHRHAPSWPDPERFDPERFSEAEKAKRPRHHWLPFGLGSRQCIGNALALMEMQIILATLVHAVEIRDVDGPSVIAQPHFTLGPRGGLPARVSYRSPTPQRDRADGAAAQ